MSELALSVTEPHEESQGGILLAASGTQEMYRPSETGTGKANDEKAKLSRLIEMVNDRLGTDFDAQDLINGVTNQFVTDEKVQQAVRANFEFVGAPAFDGALKDRHVEHGRLTDRVFSAEEMLKFLRSKVLDEVYERVSGGK